MGFFSKKTTSPKDTKDLSVEENAVITEKIRTMQDDLNAIEQDGHMEIYPEQKESSEKQKPAPLKPSAAKSIPSDSPFSKSIYPAQDQSAIQTKTISQPFGEEAAPKAAEPEGVSSTPVSSARSSAPLNLPAFQTNATPHTPIHQDTLPQTAAPSRNSVPESIMQDSVAETPGLAPEPLRTGSWPVDPAATARSISSNPKKTMSEISLPKTQEKQIERYDQIILKDGLGWKKISLIIAITGSIIGGAFYFWKTRLSTDTASILNTDQPSMPNLSSEPKSGSQKENEASALPFSQNNPNPFLIDVETETVSTIREKLLKDAETMKQANMTGPVPFSVVDKTNTPIAFFIFASILNLGLSGDLLNSLDNTFTLSIFLDNGEPRIVLTITTKNPADAQKYLSLSEKTLPISLKNLLLVDAPPTIPTATFSTVSYGDATIRYFNFPGDIPLSFDYAIVGNKLIIGTSKNSERAEIDNVLKIR